MEKETVPINVEIPYAIHQEAKIQAIRERMELREYVVRAIDNENKRR